jgi:hypothetical protein
MEEKRKMLENVHSSSGFSRATIIFHTLVFGMEEKMIIQHEQPSSSFQTKPLLEWREQSC